MGTCSYVLTGTEKGMQTTFGTTCHGAVSIAFNFLVYYLQNLSPVENIFLPN